MTDGAQIDGAEATHLVEGRVGQHLARSFVTIPAKIIFYRLVFEAALLRDRLQALQALHHHLRAGAVPRYHRDPVCQSALLFVGVCPLTCRSGLESLQVGQPGRNGGGRLLALEKHSGCVPGTLDEL